MLVVLGTDCIDSCKSNYHAIMTTMAPKWEIIHNDISESLDCHMIECIYKGKILFSELIH
jgi:hypothetical protein